VLTPEEAFADTVQKFTDTGKVWFTDDEAQIQALRDVVFPGGHLNKDVVGISAREVGAMAGIDVPESARLIMLPAKGAGTDDILAREKLCPVVAILPYTDFAQAVQLAKANLLVEGAGHSAALHSNDEANIRHAGLELPISRLVVNQPSSLTAGGSLTNGFAPTTTLGCGSWGGNSISGEPRLQAPDERLAHRQSHREQAGADRRGNLGLIFRVVPGSRWDRWRPGLSLRQRGPRSRIKSGTTIERRDSH
jgi:succinate-semialdehyde dehydrogenase